LTGSGRVGGAQDRLVGYLGLHQVRGGLCRVDTYQCVFLGAEVHPVLVQEIFGQRNLVQCVSIEDAPGAYLAQGRPVPLVSLNSA
jgi:hypothetical protein